MFSYVTSSMAVLVKCVKDLAYLDLIVVGVLEIF